MVACVEWRFLVGCFAYLLGVLGLGGLIIGLCRWKTQVVCLQGVTGFALILFSFPELARGEKRVEKGELFVYRGLQGFGLKMA